MSKSLSLGYEDPYCSPCAPCCDEKKEKEPEPPKIVYPSLCLNGDAAKALARRYGTDDNVTITITGRVSLIQSRGEGTTNWEKPGTRIEIECKEIQGLSNIDVPDNPDKTAGDALDSYFKGKKTGGED